MTFDVKDMESLQFHNYLERGDNKASKSAIRCRMHQNSHNIMSGVNISERYANFNRYYRKFRIFDLYSWYCVFRVYVSEMYDILIRLLLISAAIICLGINLIIGFASFHLMSIFCYYYGFYNHGNVKSLLDYISNKRIIDIRMFERFVFNNLQRILS
ncbi:MAG: hypothetical protein MHMPM18_000028 [Marteilia pararefringens]